MGPKSRALAALVAGLLTGTFAVGDELPHDPDNGELVKQSSGYVAWSEPRDAWLGVEAFWRDYAERTAGRYWGQGADYPPYREVNEHDTFLVELEQGTCLMYFFHGRWRRAEDVRRWDPTFNELLGCPYVFD